MKVDSTCAFERADAEDTGCARMRLVETPVREASCRPAPERGIPAIARERRRRRVRGARARRAVAKRNSRSFTGTDVVRSLHERWSNRITEEVERDAAIDDRDRSSAVNVRSR